MAHFQQVLCMLQDASERLNHAETKEEGYIIMQAMLATLGMH